VAYVNPVEEAQMNADTRSIGLLAALHRQAQLALAAAEFARAADLSDDISRLLAETAIAPVLAGDQAARPYSVLVVAHRPVPAHREMLRTLLQLSPDSCEIILIENAAEPVLAPHVPDAPGHLRLFRLGANLGIGIARQIGFRVARGRGVICIDDDGLTGPADIAALIETFETYQATAVRGRVLALTPDSTMPPHYDPGDRRLRSYCDVEGMAIWNRQHVLDAGGFDPILYGHEGVELVTRLYAAQGPEAFIYEPRAILRHDYASGPEQAAAKAERYLMLDQYLAFRRPGYDPVKRAMARRPGEAVADALLSTRRDYAAAPAVRTAPSPDVSILTTCRDGAAFIDDYVASLLRQTDTNFEVVFVDDGSQDGSLARLRAAAAGRLRIVPVETGGLGRAAAMNRAVDAAQGEVCLVADVDDVSIPQRVAWTREACRRHPDAAMIGFMIYDDRNPARAVLPFPIAPVPLQVRAYFGMPCPFPAFSFRKSAAVERFDETLAAGSDCDWLFRSVIDRDVPGVFLPLNLAYYRTHPGQITTSRRDLQRAVALRHVSRLHGRALGRAPDLAPDLAPGGAAADNPWLEMLTGWEALTSGACLRGVTDYAMQVVEGAPLGPDLRACLRTEMVRHLDGLHLGLLKGDYQRSKTRLATVTADLQASRAALHKAGAGPKARLAGLMRDLATAELLAAADARRPARAQDIGSARIALLVESLRKAREEVRAAERDVGLLKASTSWRLTAPLRLMSRGARRLLSRDRAR
jgi:glycosyltransferase involved in cell wall biosynthesis